MKISVRPISIPESICRSGYLPEILKIAIYYDVGHSRLDGKKRGLFQRAVVAAKTDKFCITRFCVLFAQVWNS